MKLVNRYMSIGAKRLASLCPSAFLLTCFVLPCMGATSEVQTTRDFVIDDVKLIPNPDESLSLEASVFNVGPADGVLEVRDSHGIAVGRPILILGHRPIPDSLYAIVVQNQINVVRSFTSSYFPLDKRNPSQSRETRIRSVMIPVGGSVRITKASDYAIAYNVLGLIADSVGLVSTGGKTINERLVKEIVEVLATKLLAGFKARVLARDLGPKDILAFAAEIAFDLTKTVLKPENLDGRTVLGRAVKKYAVDLSPYTAALETVAVEGWAFNWLNAMVNLEAAYINDSTLLVNLIPNSVASSGVPIHALDCRSEGSLKSVNFDTSTKLEFINSSTQEMWTFWINYDGKRVFYTRLDPGKSYVQQTYVTHPWVVTNSSDQCVAIYLPSAEPSSVVIR